MRRLLTIGLLAVLLPQGARAQAPEQTAPDAPVWALIRTGDYARAEQVARRRLQESPGNAGLQRAMARALVRKGRTTEAEPYLRTASASGSPVRLPAMADLGELLYLTGRRDEAMETFDWFIDAYNGGLAVTAADMVAVGTACRYLGKRDPALYQDALRAYDEAVALDPEWNLPHRLTGDLFLDRYNSDEAQKSYDAALALDPEDPEALLGVARRLQFDNKPGALEAAREALKVNPNLVDAQLFIAGLLQMQEDRDGAAQAAGLALRVDPTYVPAMAVEAATHYLQDDRGAYEADRARALAVDPKASYFYVALAQQCVQSRRYEEAADFARQAIELVPTDWEAHGLLGINLLRTGRIAEGRGALETAFAGDPYNVWFKNTLDLLDTFVDYRSERSDRMEAVIVADEAPVLAPYLLPLAEEAYTALSEKYEYAPPTPIRIEVFPNHGDFSVRTVGLVGLGALGVCFGPVIAMDSPTARPPGDFNWGTTLWHELTHSITLGMTDHRIPRWFSEGLSVYEERRARPGWGAETDLTFLYLVLKDELRGIGEINEGFVRPRSAEEVPATYFQASLVCEWVTEQRGFAAIRSMLNGYRQGLDTEAVFQRVLGMSLEGFDKTFTAWVRERYATELGSLRARDYGEEGAGGQTLADYEERVADDADDFRAHLVVGLSREAQGLTDEALVHLDRARHLFPTYGGPDGPLPALARIHEARGDTTRAIRALADYLALNEDDIAARVHLAGLYNSGNRPVDAAGVLEDLLYIDPFAPELHQSLAGLSQGLGRWPEAVRERRAFLALDPVDKVDAWYRLALAQEGAGDRAGARRSVLHALEIAPNYSEGLDLLVRLQKPPAPAGEGGGR